MIKRAMGEKILYLSKKFPIVTVTGPRQSGKTTLIRNLFPKHKYISLEDPDTRLHAESDPKGFLVNAGSKFILDEVQRVPEIFSYLQAVADSSSNNGRIILSGSQSFLLYEKISQSLAGRAAMCCLLPFSIKELQDAQIKIKTPEVLIYKGFYPRLYKERIKPIDFYPGYIQTYVERDVRLLKNIGDLNGFIGFVKLCAGRAGQILNFSSLANDAGISVNTAKSWISVLEASYIIFLLHPYYKNFNKRIIKMPKLMFYDTGLLCSLLGISDHKQLTQFYMLGNLFENFIISEFLKNRYNKAMPHDMFYWRDNKGNEIDLVIEKNSKLIAIEIKHTSTFNTSYFKQLERFSGLSNAVSGSFVINGGNENYINGKYKFISWSKINELDI